MAFLNWRFGFTQTTLWRIEVASFPIRRPWLAPQKASPSPPLIYRYRNGDDAEEGGAEPCVDERVTRHNLHPYIGRHTSGVGGFQDTQNTLENAHPRPP